MINKASFRHPAVLLVGDTLVLVLVTLAGFASHRTLGSAGGRILATFIPFWAAWLFVAYPIGLFDPARAVQFGQLWRPLWAMALAAPLGSWLRGLWLNAPVQPVFVAVMLAVGGAAFLAWRLVFVLALRKNGEPDSHTP